MRLIVGLLKWLGILILLGIVVLLIWPWKPVVMERMSAGPYRDYLENNVQRLDLAQDEPGFAFPESFYDNKLFLLGEIHGAQTAQDVDLAFMKHLNRRAGVRWMMAELSYVQAERFNAYLDTGDETYLAPVFESWLASSTQWGNQQHYDKLIALRAYNQTLPAEERLRYFGIDRISERDLDDAAFWLSGMLADLSTAAPQELLALQTAVNGFDAATFSAVTGRALLILDAADDEEAAAWGVDRQAIRHLVRNLNLSLSEGTRYQAFLSNIDAMVWEFGIGDDEPLYGFWGLFHVMKAVINETAEPLALRLLSSDLPFADGIVSMTMVYTDSLQNMPSYVLPEFLQSGGPYTDVPMGQSNPYLMYLYGIGDLRAAADGADVAVFSLDGAGSPYRESTRLKTQTGVLTKVFRFEVTPPEQRPSEYVVLIDGSPALTAWQGTE